MTSEITTGADNPVFISQIDRGIWTRYPTTSGPHLLTKAIID
jgi:hypothetical protein